MDKEPKNISDLDLSFQHPNDPDTDFRTEVIIASLIEQGYDPDQISIIRKGTARRGFSTDINELYHQYSMHALQDHLYISANREGMYDMLPEGIFHQPIYKKREKDIEEILDEVKVHREEEFFARKFFHLFEMMADKTLVEAYQYEAKYDKKFNNKEFINLFLPYWPILQLLEHRQAIFFMHIIPILHNVRTHNEDVAEAISFILDVPVTITNIELPSKIADRFFESKVGENCLGVDFVLGSSFNDGENDLKLTIGPISAYRMSDFIKTAKGYQLLEMLCEQFLPVGTFVVKEFKILPEDSSFILSDDNNTTFLGVNSFI